MGSYTPLRECAALFILFYTATSLCSRTYFQTLTSRTKFQFTVSYSKLYFPTGTLLKLYVAKPVEEGGTVSAQPFS